MAVRCETHVTLSDLNEEELLKELKKKVDKLQKFKSYDDSRVSHLVQSISDIFYTGMNAGDVLAETEFADVAIRILKDMKENGRLLSEEPSVRETERELRSILCNFTDDSLNFAKKVAEAGGVQFLTDECSHKPYLCSPSDKRVNKVIELAMGTLFITAKATGVQQYFIDSKTAEVIASFLRSHAEAWGKTIEILATLTLSYIVEEKKSKKVIAKTDIIESIIEFLNLALKNGDRYMGFSSLELMGGLSNLAVNDKNKQKIIEANALPVFRKMLESESKEAQLITVNVIWTLAFDKNVCQSIVAYEDMMPVLENLKKSLRKSSNTDLFDTVNGALHVLTGKNDVSQHQKSEEKNKGHIFLSYSWDEKAIVYEINNRLKAEGFTVWIDVEQMKGGHLYEKMAEAVENASVVLIGVSESYNKSPNCRLEADYAVHLKKEYIPLRLQKNYRPNSWLGLLTSGKIRYDFSGKYGKDCFGREWENLLDILKPHKCVNQSLKVENAVQVERGRKKISNMSQEEVVLWLKDKKLDKHLNAMKEFDGELLAQLKQMKSEAPEFYYRRLKKELKMEFVEILKFSAALDKL